MVNEQSNILLPLPKGKKMAVTFGSICLMLSVAMFGAGFFVIQGPVLKEMNASEYYSLLTIFASLGLSIMTPVGGKLGDLFGRRNVVVLSGSICAVCAIGMGLIKTVIPFILLRLVLSAAQGTFAAAPYILMREINEPKDVPRAMGLLASAVAIGGFGGGILLGAMADVGLLGAAIIVPVVPLTLGVVLIGMNLPNKKAEGKIKVDVKGMACLAVLLSAFSLSMNYGAILGWMDIKILTGLTLTAVSFFVFVKIEQKEGKTALVPMHLFKNKEYTLLLFVGFICYFYNTAMTAYVPLAMQQVMGASAMTSGAVQLPRTILTMILPTFLGVWVGKRKQNYWIAMALATGIVIAAFIPLGFTTPSTPVLLYFAAIAMTGIAEGFRSVAVTPAAQATLEPEDLGIGSSLTTFFNSLSGLIGSAMFGVLYAMNADSVQRGINHIFLFSAAATVVGFAVVLLVVRKFEYTALNTSGNSK